MFGIGMPELIIILAVALIVIGPKKLPDLAKSLGRAFNEFRKATQELKASIDLDDGLKDVKKTFDDLNAGVRQGVKDPAPSAPSTPAAPAEETPDPRPAGSEKPFADTGPEGTKTHDA